MSHPSHRHRTPRWRGGLVVGLLILASSGIGITTPAPAARLPTAASPTLPTTGTTLPPGPAVRLVQIATADQPIGVVSRAADGALYVQEKTGRVRALIGGTWHEPAVLDLHSKVSTQNERGLLGLAFSPADPAHLYAAYSALDGATTVSEFAFSANTMRADESSERVLLRVAHPNDDHYGGALAFSNDGLLYIGLGDGGGVGTKGGVGDKANNAQNTGVLLGKILRIDPKPSGQQPYTVPPSNPFSSGRSVAALGASAAARPEVFDYGLRNPWRMSMDGEGNLWIPDVGQSSWEEINRVPAARAGINFGWRKREGTHAYLNGSKPAGAVDPVYEFPHADGRCAVIGGAVAGPGTGVAALSGSYVFGELCTGRLMALQPGDGRWAAFDLGARTAYLTSVGTAADGTLVVTSLNGGVYRVTAA